MTVYQKLVNLVNLFRKTEPLAKDIGRITFPHLLPGKDRPDQQVQTTVTPLQLKMQTAKFKGSPQQQEVSNILQGNSKNPKEAGITLNYKNVVTATQNKKGEDTPFTQEHEGLHYLMGEIQNKYGRKTVGNLYSKLNQTIHPEDSAAIDAHLRHRGYNNDEINVEKVHFLRDILSNKDARHEFLNIANNNKKPYNIDRMKNSWKEIVNYAKSIKPEHI